MKDIKKYLIPLLVVILCLVCIGCSINYGLNTAGTPNRYEKTIASIDEELSGVLKLSALTTGISATITAIPGDTGTPIADHLMALTTWLLVVIVVLFFQKYSLTLIGKLTFMIIIPIVIGMFGVGILKHSKKLLLKGVNGLLIASLIFFAIPASAGLSNEIKETYEFSLNNTLAEAENAKAKTDEATDDSADDNKNFIEGAISKVTDAVSSTVMGGLDAAENFLNTLTESLAVLVVTSCVIPMLVLVLFIWLIKKLVEVDLSKPLLICHDHIDKSVKSLASHNKKENSK